MSRSSREERHKKHKYSSARGRAEQKEKEASFSASYLKRPDGVTMFKPKAGIMLLDIIPYEVGEGNPCAEPGTLHYERTFYLHPRIGANNQAYMCPRLSAKEPCPICEMRSKMLKDNSDKEELVKDMAPKERQLFNVIDRKAPEKGVQLWEISYHLFGKLLDARIRNSDEDEGWDKFFFLEGGMTLKVGFKEKSFGGRTFLEAETIDFKSRTEDIEEDVLEKTVNLDEVLITPDYDDLKEAFLEMQADTDDDDADDSDDDEKPAAKKKSKPSEDEDEDSEEDEDDEPAPKKKSKAVDEDEDSEDEDEETEEDEPAPKKKSKPSEDEDDEEEDDEPAPKAKKKSKEDDEDWDDFDEDNDKPSKKKSKDSDDEDEDEDSEDEDDEPAPKKKSKSEDEDEDAEEDEEDEQAPKRRR